MSPSVRRFARCITPAALLIGSVCGVLSAQSSTKPLTRDQLLAALDPDMRNVILLCDASKGTHLEQLSPQDARQQFAAQDAAKIIARGTGTAEASTGSLRSTLATAKSWAETDFREEMNEEMKRITIPVLVIPGTSDHTVSINASGRRSAKLLPNATLSEYDGEPQGLFMRAADRLNEELLEFLGGPREPSSTPVLS